VCKKDLKKRKNRRASQEGLRKSNIKECKNGESKASSSRNKLQGNSEKNPSSGWRKREIRMSRKHINREDGLGS